MRALICAGGTGGGVYPALAVHQALKTSNPRAQVLWVGGEGGMESRLVERAGIPFKAIPAAGIHGVSIQRLPGNLVALARGVIAAAKILKEYKPDVLFFTGGFIAVPMALAGRKIPSLLYVPDIEPGLALKALAWFARCITVTAEDSRRFFSHQANIIVTGYPVRPELATWERSAARKNFSIAEDQKVVLIFGGSKGARSINNALLEQLGNLLKHAEVIHISGELDWPTVEAFRKALPEDQRKQYHAFPYLHEEMGAALAAADLVVSRAGASILGEFPLFGVPAILVPYPYAWRYQMVNAETLVQRGAALILEDSRLISDLYQVIENLLESPAKLDAMRTAMHTLKTPRAASNIAAQLCILAGDTQ